MECLREVYRSICNCLYNCYYIIFQRQSQGLITLDPKYPFPLNALTSIEWVYPTITENKGVSQDVY